MGQIGSAAPSLIQAFSGQTLIGQGASIATQGADISAQAAIQGSELASTLALQGGAYSADVYRSYETTAVQQATYNVALSQTQTNRQYDALSRQINDVQSKNISTMTANGLGLGSKSYLAVSNTYLNQAENQFLQLKNNAMITQQQLITEGQVEATRFENQARGAEYQGQVQSTVDLYQGKVQATEATYAGQVAAYNAKAAGAQNSSKLIQQGVSTLLSG